MGVNGWSLEVVRGREAGRAYALVGPETVLGNALAGAAGIDLAGQEGDTPRPMAARQAVVDATGPGLTLRDLDSPGGTFVNRQRVLPGQARPLRPGDLIQLGTVHLRLVESAGRARGNASTDVRSSGNAPGPHPVATPGRDPAPFSFALRNGTVCRSWDDFLRASSQRWADLRDDLRSGRVAAWLATIGRPDLAVARAPGMTDDEHLDAWLAAIPATGPARPELEVHPQRLVVRATPGGGTVSRSVQVSNVGHRLLKVRAAIEPAGTGWAEVVGPRDGAWQTVVDHHDLPIAIAIPDALPTPLRATLRIESNGGDRRVELILEPRSAVDPISTSPRPTEPIRPGLADWLGEVSTARRFAVMAVAGAGLRLIVALAGGLPGAVAAFATVAGMAGGVAGSRRGTSRDAIPGAISGGIAGAMLAAVVVAASRAVDSVLGGWGSAAVATVAWALIGAAGAATSLAVVPDRTRRAAP